MFPDLGGLVDVAKRCAGLAAILVSLYFIYRPLCRRTERAGLAVMAIFVIAVAVNPSWIILLVIAAAIGAAALWLRIKEGK